MKHQYIFFLGNHPSLSAAEAWRRVEASTGVSPRIVHATFEVLILETARKLDPVTWKSAGGFDRIGYVVHTWDSVPTAHDVLEAFCKNEVTKKRRLGLSGVDVSFSSLRSIGTELKRLCKEGGGSLQFILPTKGNRLNAAQVLKHDLLNEPHGEITIVKVGSSYSACRTVFAQDVAAYERRDTDRPVRDPQVGMVPPKLAQLMLGLTLSPTCLTPTSQPSEASVSGSAKCAVWDPFCGLGTVAQEAWLMGLDVFASDLNPLMVSATKENLSWLSHEFPSDIDADRYPKVFEHDATATAPSNILGLVTAIVTEPHLGSPLSSLPAPAEIETRNKALSDKYISFLAAAKPALVAGGRVLLLLPTLQRGYGDFVWFPDSFLDAADRLGYRRLQLIPDEIAAHYEQLGRRMNVYARPDAIVGRELTLWEKR